MSHQNHSIQSNPICSLALTTSGRVHHTVLLGTLHWAFSWTEKAHCLSAKCDRKWFTLLSTCRGWTVAWTVLPVNRCDNDHVRCIHTTTVGLGPYKIFYTIHVCVCVCIINIWQYMQTHAVRPL